jgi:hypothetical protein
VTLIRTAARPHLAVDLFGLRHAAEAAKSCEVRVSGRHAAALVLVRGFGQVRVDLVAEIAIDPPRLERGQQPPQQCAKPVHGRPSEIFRNLPTIAVARSHSKASACPP